jgi:hypothetical protein
VTRLDADAAAMTALLAALQSPPTSDELAGEGRARALFTAFGPDRRHRRVRPLRGLLPGPLAAAAAVTISIGAVTAAAAGSPVERVVRSVMQAVVPWDAGPAATPSGGTVVPAENGRTTPEARRTDLATAPASSWPPTPTTRATGTGPSASPSASSPVPQAGLTSPKPSAAATDDSEPLCRAYARGKITSPRLKRLTAHAGGASRIPAYCAKILG